MNSIRLASIFVVCLAAAAPTAAQAPAPPPPPPLWEARPSEICDRRCGRVTRIPRRQWRGSTSHRGVFERFPERELRASSSHFDDAMMRRARMTIAALGKRIDARFARAERRKDARFGAVDARFAAVDARFDAVDARFDRLEAGIEIRFAQADRKIESLGEKLDRIAHMLDNQYRHQQETLDEHEARLQDLERAARG